MNQLIEILNKLKHESPEKNEALLVQAITLASTLSKEQQELREELSRLTQIISDIRERDARKKCLCRGF